ncbi:MAG: metallopeptidase TldD-related protein, partial [Armatimonadota bacterium]
RKRSYLIGLEGKKVASEIVTIVDDPLIDYGINSRSADGEGTPCSKFTIIENGVLKSYLYSSYTANKVRVKPTGHGNRDGNTSTSNIIPKLGTKTAAEIIADTKNGIYINSRGLNANMITGDVSDTIDFGIRIENGELAYPVQSSMIGGNILDILKNIDAVSSDYRGNQPGIVMPTIRIDDVLVAGAE